jgi:uncharacterized membrane protein
MQDHIDETDGTPEWAKRMFRRLRTIRAWMLILLLILGLPIMCIYQIYSAIMYGEVWKVDLHRSVQWVSYAENPTLFVFGLVLAIGILIVWAMGLALYHRIRRIPEHFKVPAK